jgi:hypothetical protein
LKKSESTQAPCGLAGAKQVFHRFAGQDGESGIKHAALVRTQDDAQGR